jgi:transcription elongation factor GreA
LAIYNKKCCELNILYICYTSREHEIFCINPKLVWKHITVNAILITNEEIMSNVSYYTEEGLKKLRNELRQLKDIERPKVSQAIADARDKGDLSENAEYDAAKEAQGMLEMKIAKLEETLAGARLIDESQLDASKILVLSIVKIKNQSNGMEMTYTLVADGEADLASGKISVNSPIGKGLLGKSVGEVAEIQVPNGVMKFDILEISR